MVTIGDTVLFKIDPADFGIWRPLLVTHVNDDGSVEGEVFFNWNRDRIREWPLKHLFFGLSNQHRTVEVMNVKLGDQVGEYKLKEPFRGKLQPVPEPTKVPTLEKKK